MKSGGREKIFCSNHNANYPALTVHMAKNAKVNLLLKLL